MRDATRPEERSAGELKRAANDLICATVLELVPEQPFFCECDDSSCMGVVWLSRRRYEELRRRPEWSPLLEGHRGPAPDGAAHERRPGRSRAATAG